MLVYRSNRIEALADRLAALLRVPAAGPMQAELVVVHSKGMERWVAMQLAERLGICANVRFPFPARVLHGLLGGRGSPAEPVTIAWSPERLVWTILQALPGLLGQPAFAPLQAYLEPGPAGTEPAPVGRKAWLLARRLADVFDRYVTYRPELVLGWDAEAERGPGDEADPDWQPLLWRELRRRIAAPNLADWLRGQAAMPELDDLPARLCFFGMATLPPFFVEVLSALARVSEVHLFVLSPSREFFGGIRSRREIARELAAARRDAVSPEQLHLEEGNPLLASFGRLSREFQLVLEESTASSSYLEPQGELFVEPLPEGPERPTMLQVLQSDILNLRHRRGNGREDDDPERCPPALPLEPDDASIRVHSCHGPMRQVEVLRDELLALLDADPTLQPRDIVVMAPDIEAFAPLLEAVFADGAREARPAGAGSGAAGAGSGAGSAGADEGGAGFPPIPFRLADRGLRQENLVAEALLAVLELGRGRVPASAVLDLLALEPVRQRFAIAAEELPTLRSWVGESGIRWGIDREHRLEHGQPGYLENTWRFGLDRLLLGFAMPGEGRRFFGGVLPYDEVEGGASGLLGRFADFCETLFARLRRLAAPRTLPAWRDELSSLLTALTAVDEQSAWLQQELRDVCDRLVACGEAAGFTGLVAPDVLPALLEAGLPADRPAAGFLTGAVTCCAMVPLRSIPFRVVCLLGLDDGAFPRTVTRLGFDKLATARRLGDRDPREEDRFLFLEALLSARERLIITYTGRGIHDNAVLPPAVPVGELLDVLAASFESGDEGGPGVRGQVLIEHPLQPFSPRCFAAPAAAPAAVAARPQPSCAEQAGSRDVPDGGSAGRPQSFDRRYLAGARMLCGERQEPPPFFSGPLPPDAAGGRDHGDPAGSVTIDELVRFLAGPARYLCERRLGLRLVQEEDVVADREPITPDGLERWVLASRLLEAKLAGEQLQATLQAARGSGALPLGRPGECLFADLDGQVEPIHRRVASLRRGTPRAVALSTTLRHGALLGTISGIWEPGLVVSQLSHIRGKHLLGFWVRHLALELAGEEVPSHLVGRPAKGELIHHVLRPPTGPGPGSRSGDGAGDGGASAALLDELLALYHRGLTGPLLFFPETSRAYAEARRKSGGGEEGACSAAVAAAARAWEDEAADPYLARIFGTAQPYEPGFVLHGFAAGPGASFHDLAVRVWDPLLERLETV